MNALLQRTMNYVSFGLDFFVLRTDRPHILGLVTNDTCNLRCVDCRVANVNGAVMSMSQDSCAFTSIRMALSR